MNVLKYRIILLFETQFVLDLQLVKKRKFGPLDQNSKSNSVKIEKNTLFLYQKTIRHHGDRIVT